jgi:hypothetical protein
MNQSRGGQYHLVTIAIEKGPAAKIIATNAKKLYVKNLPAAPAPIQMIPGLPGLPFPLPKGN